MVTARQILAYIHTNVHIFQEPQLVRGTAYHYTPHWEMIERDGRLNGIRLHPGIAATQTSDISDPATDPNGFLFAYGLAPKAAEEGAVKQIVRIKFTEAVSVIHRREWDYIDGLVQRGVSGLHKDRTLLVPCRAISEFQNLGLGRTISAKLDKTALPELELLSE